MVARKKVARLSPSRLVQGARPFRLAGPFKGAEVVSDLRQSLRSEHTCTDGSTRKPRKRRPHPLPAAGGP